MHNDTANTNNWLSEINRLKNTYFPVRTLNVLNQAPARVPGHAHALPEAQCPPSRMLPTCLSDHSGSGRAS